MGVSNLTGKCLKNAKQSAISYNLLQWNCAINFDDYDNLTAELNKLKLLLNRGLPMKHEKPILNRSIKLSPLELLFNMTLLSPLPHDCHDLL